jgi:hypothetical protein
MKYLFSKLILLGVVLFALASCHKSIEATILPVKEAPSFVHYRIARGEHYSEQGTYAKVEYTELRFLVKFDSSAIYTTANPNNQYDINKLYGFSDNDAHHHEFSARIGWRWSKEALRLFGYIYNNGIVNSEEITTINISSENDCSIKISGNSYIFSVNGKTTSMPRTSTGAVAKGYKLFPYFGGDETAPHDIHIWIKEK